MGITLTIDTLQKLNDTDLATKFFDLLEKHGLYLEKLGLYEPLKQEYSKEKGIEIWCLEDEGCFDIESNKSLGKAGGVLGKSKTQGFTMHVVWWDCPWKKTNYIWFHFQKKAYKAYKTQIQELFKDLIILTNGLYGYISDEIAVNRQHVTGTIQERISGVFWCNYFGPPLLEVLRKENVESFSWYNSVKVDNGGVITYLTSDALDIKLKSNELETKAQEYIGSHWFNGKAANYHIF
ncbi:hypothetical protein COM21_30485 [Bacillus toyonensis]|uniref:hypothetical protein n=1 Tax=Bacillus TaxID=1386 RepID=UPI000872D824|nr:MULTISPECIES: hypothetical protein [Bacillus cereus group]OFC80244.1 hypothetical protein BTGOE1_17670 [Bacillus thuringiensis]OFC81447.1 hypothetical protein BTGOE2_31030 [Bacillus thuringiensis]PGC60020.1 hypothetical protein COM21_30485 [Bacillus toyonensis]